MFFTIMTIQVFPKINPKLRLYSPLSFGKYETLLYSISSICEDQNKNIFILDAKAYKVHKFSNEGKYLLSFGNRGQGPGDFLRPHSIQITNDDKIVINEERDFVSIFSKKGKFQKCIKVEKGLGIYFLNYNLFYCWTWGGKIKQQLLIDEKGNIIKSFYSLGFDKFSISLPDETGRLVMFNYYAEEYTPSFVFSYYKNYSAIGISNKYEIYIIQNDGKMVSKIFNHIEPEEFSKCERMHLIDEIKNYYKFPDNVKKKFIKQIPGCKNFFNNILMSDQLIWIIRVREDVTKPYTDIPVDLYTYDAKSQGTLFIKEQPIFVSGEYIYFARSNEEEDLYITRYKYDIEQPENMQ